MCVSTGPAELTGTTLFLGKKYLDGHPVFTLGYQNTAQSLIGNSDNNANCMLLHIPTANLHEKNFIPTANTRHILEDMVIAVQPVTRGMSLGISYGVAKSIEIFDYDVYTIAIAQRPIDLIENIDAVLATVARKHPEKVIQPNLPLFKAYAQWFPDYAIALCLFNNINAKEAAPIFLYYEPLNPNLFQLPALDCHTGAIPNLNTSVDVDHWVILASDDMPKGTGSPVDYRDEAKFTPLMKALLPNQVIGRQFAGLYANGDFYIDAKDVRMNYLSKIGRLAPSH